MLVLFASDSSVQVSSLSKSPAPNLERRGVKRRGRRRAVLPALDGLGDEKQDFEVGFVMGLKVTVWSNRGGQSTVVARRKSAWIHCGYKCRGERRGVMLFSRLA